MAHGRGGFKPQKRVGDHLLPGDPAQSLRNKGRLIVAPRPDPPAMEWHRDEQRALQPLGAAGQLRRDQPSNHWSAAMFEFEDRFLCARAIGDNGANAIKRGGVGEALRTQASFARIDFERQTTTRAFRSAQKGQLGPARRAKFMVVGDNDPAGGTTWRQREIQRRGHNWPFADWQLPHDALVARQELGHKPAMAVAPLPPDIFDRERRRRAYGIASGQSEAPLFHENIAEGLIDRLDMVVRTFPSALLVNPIGKLLDAAVGQKAETIDHVYIGNAKDFAEDRPSLPRQSYDLIIAPWGLDSVNDLPGGLTLLRSAMKPDSLFLASFPGAGSFAALRDSFRAADEKVFGQIFPRFHPQIDVRAMGDLLARAGFTLPVIDVDSFDLRYSDIRRATADLREQGWRNQMMTHGSQLTRAYMQAANRYFLANGPADERLSIITVTAWTPGENQPKPATRGSGAQSLATVLGQSGKPRG